MNNDFDSSMSCPPCPPQYPEAPYGTQVTIMQQQVPPPSPLLNGYVP